MADTALRHFSSKSSGNVMVAETRIFKQRIAVLVGWVLSTHLHIDILVAVVVDIRKTDAMPLLQVAKATRHSHIDELLTTHVEKHDVRPQLPVKDVARREIEVEIAVAI